MATVTVTAINSAKKMPDGAIWINADFNYNNTEVKYEPDENGVEQPIEVVTNRVDTTTVKYGGSSELATLATEKYDADGITPDDVPAKPTKNLTEYQDQIDQLLSQERSLNIALADTIRRLANGLFAEINARRASDGQGPITQQQFVQYLDGPDGDQPISAQEMRNYIKNKIS